MRIKYIRNNGETFLQISLPEIAEWDTITESALYYHQDHKNILPFTKKINRRKKILLNYEITDLICLASERQRDTSVELQRVREELSDLLIKENQILTDPKQIFRDPKSGELKVLVLPLLNVTEALEKERELEELENREKARTEQELRYKKEEELRWQEEKQRKRQEMELQRAAEIDLSRSSLKRESSGKKEYVLIRKRTGEIYALTSDGNRIGRHPKNEVPIVGNTSIGRLHCYIFFQEENGVKSCFIEDNHSANHTLLNGFQLPEGHAYLLMDGDTILLADEEFLFRMIE